MIIEITTASGIHDVTTFPEDCETIAAKDDSRIMLVSNKDGRILSVYNMQHISHLCIDFEE